MERERSKIGSRILLVLILTAFALPAWGAPPPQGPPFQQKAGKVAIVAQSGGDYTSPVTAMSNVATWCGTPSAANPCLVKIMPGVYDLAGGSLTMQPYVDIEGSGEITTIISSAASGVVNGADNAEVRFLTVKSTVPSGQAVAIQNFDQSPKITHVTVIASGGVGSTGIFNVTSHTTMSDVTAIASGGKSYGVSNGNSITTMNNVTVIASGDESYGVWNGKSGTTMSNVTASAKGYSSVAYGVYAIDASLTMNNVIVTASADGSPAAYGVYASHGASLYMSNVTATAQGGSSALTNYGVYVSESVFTTMSNVTAIARDASANYGLYALIPSTTYADRSTFQGNTNSVYADTRIRLNIGASKLIGPVANNVGTLGTLTCAASYNGDYVALGTDCQVPPSP